MATDFRGQVLTVWHFTKIIKGTISDNVSVSLSVSKGLMHIILAELKDRGDTGAHCVDPTCAHCKLSLQMFGDVKNNI